MLAYKKIKFFLSVQYTVLQSVHFRSAGTAFLAEFTFILEASAGDRCDCSNQNTTIRSSLYTGIHRRSGRALPGEPAGGNQKIRAAGGNPSPGGPDIH